VRGLALLGDSASGPLLSEYHIEAAIAAEHSTAKSCEDTDWRTIATLYDSLYAMRPSPVVALSRAIALGQLEGPERGIDALENIADRERLRAIPVLPCRSRRVLSPSWPRRRGWATSAPGPLLLARNQAESRFLDRRIAAVAAFLKPEA
jgi:RNA polymerase sigma-70 factor (ECF subfamily)